MLKILHLAKQNGGRGASECASLLHCSMKAAGVESALAVMRKTGDDVSVIDLGSLGYERARHVIAAAYAKPLRSLLRSSAFFYLDSEFITASRILERLPFRPDVIIAHWITSFLTHRTLHDLHRLTGAPVLWYLADMGPLTGGCHYSFDCEGYAEQCGNCPQLRRAWRSSRDMSHRQWRARRAAVLDMDITPVAGSSWLMECLKKSSVFQGKPGKTILMGLDTSVFQPREQAKARETLGLPRGKKIVFFGACDLQEERKGIRHLVAALNKLHSMLEDAPSLREDVLVVTAGVAKNAAELAIPFAHRHIGFLQGDAMLAAGYQSADVFVNASVQDGGPMMINESLLCGTPVVAFDMGVAPDLVHSGRTGYRARLKDSDDMAAGLRQLLELDGASRAAMRSECRRLAEELCRPAAQVRAFMEICRERLSRNHTRLQR